MKSSLKIYISFTVCSKTQILWALTKKSYLDPKTKPDSILDKKEADEPTTDRFE